MCIRDRPRTWLPRPRPRPWQSVVEDPRGQGLVLENTSLVADFSQLFKRGPMAHRYTSVFVCLQRFASETELPEMVFCSLQNYYSSVQRFLWLFVYMWVNYSVKVSNLGPLLNSYKQSAIEKLINSLFIFHCHGTAHVDQSADFSV